MVVSPSVSPEHGPVTAGCTMDVSLYLMSLRTAEATEILNGDKEYRKTCSMVAKLPSPYWTVLTASGGSKIWMTLIMSIVTCIHTFMDSIGKLDITLLPL